MGLEGEEALQERPRGRLVADDEARGLGVIEHPHAEPGAVAPGRLDGPLVRKQRPDTKEIEWRATFLIRLNNTTDRPLTFHTKPALSNTIKSKSATSGYASQKCVCVQLMGGFPAW